MEPKFKDQQEDSQSSTLQGTTQISTTTEETKTQENTDASVGISLDPSSQDEESHEQKDSSEAPQEPSAAAVADEPASYIDLDTLKEAVTQANLAIKKGKEPIYQLQIVRDALIEAAKTDRMGKDEAFNDYLNTTLGHRLMPQMARERSVDDEYLDVCADVLEAWITIFLVHLEKKRFNSDFICALTWCFQPNCNLHTLHFQFGREEIKAIALSHQTWRKDIVIGSQVDVQVGAGQNQGWMLGKVVDLTGDALTVEFPDSITDYDKVMDRWSTKLSPAGQKTKKDYEWRESTLHEAANLIVDAFDGQDWVEATILETQLNEVVPGRPVEFAYVAYRVYKEKGRKLREDENGKFEGLPAKYDQWVPIISPSLAPHLTKSLGQATFAKEEDDEELDKVIQPSYGFEKVYAVPRIYSCLSKKFIYFMDKFGNAGGFRMLLDAMESQPLSDDNLTLTSIGYMITLVSMPWKLWQRAFVDEYATRFSKAIKARFLDSDDAKIRDLDQSCSYQAIRATYLIKQRMMDRGEASQEWQVFKLQFIKKCLESQFLEKRIQGIKELNEIVVKSIEGTEAEATREIIDWICNNGVFSIIWDPKRTHMQLVQRSSDIFRCFLKEDLLTEALLAQFWNLSKSSYKQEVFKILNDCDYYLEQPQIEYLFAQITSTPATKLGIEEFDILSMLGRRCKLTQFTNQVCLYFWRVILDSKAYNQEVVDCCVNKFADMIKYWSITDKKSFFDMLAQSMQNESSPTIPVLKLFQKIVEDHKDRERIMSKASSSASRDASAASTNYGNVTSKWAQMATENEFVPVECKAVFDLLEKEQAFSQSILANLKSYYDSLQAELAKDGGATIDLNEDRKALKVLPDSKYKHHEELDERLKFLTLFSKTSSYKVSKEHLKVIYELLAASPVKGDLEEFLKWCKKACEGTYDGELEEQQVDLSEVGAFFSEQISGGDLDLKSMPPTGFHFIQMIYLTANKEILNIIEQQPRKKKDDTRKEGEMTTFYNLWDEPEDDKAKDDDDAAGKDDNKNFVVMVDPSELLHLEIIWQVVLESRVAEVYGPAINLLVASYLKIMESRHSEAERSRFLQEQLVARCFDLLKAAESEQEGGEHTVARVTLILKEVIHQSEVRGTGNVRPHRSILKGELLDRIVISYIQGKNVFGEEKVDRIIVVKLYSSCTLWELKCELASLFELGPQYLELEFPGDVIAEERDHGKDMKSFGLKKNDILTARKIQLNELIPEADLVDEETEWLTPRAEEIFTSWFHMFKNPVKEKMDSLSVARFIMRTTNNTCRPGDKKVEQVISMYDRDGDGMLTLQDFLQFYYDSAESDDVRRRACFQNLEKMNYRPDLVRAKDAKETPYFSTPALMPRFALQANEAQYRALWGLIEERKDATCAGTWDLIRMLATSEKRYMEVIRMSNVTDEDGEVDWSDFFQGSSVYQKTYLQEIILSVLEDSEESQSGSMKRIVVISDQKTGGASPAPSVIDSAKAPDAPSQSENEATSGPQETPESKEEASRKAEIAELRLNWSRNFLERGGFQYILSHMYALDTKSTSEADMQQVEFMLTLVRVFLIAAFASDSQTDIGQAVRLTRKSSSIDDADTYADKQALKKKDSVQSQKEDKLQELLRGELGMEILLSTNYNRLQQKTLSLVYNIVGQERRLTLEEKIIVENAISVWVGCSLYKPQLFDEFLHFKGPNNDASVEDLVLGGLVLCREDKIREDFLQGLLALAKNFDLEKRLQAQNFLRGILGKNFERVAAKKQLCSQYFDLFSELIDMQVARGGFVDELSEVATDSAILDASYDPETLLCQIIDRLVASTQSDEEESKSEEEASQAELVASKERTLIGLFTLINKLIKTVEPEVADKVIHDKNLINLIFKQFLFASYFKAQEEKRSGAPKKEVALVHRMSSTKQHGNSKKGGQSANKSREAAFTLLVELCKQSGTHMETFLEKVLLPMLASVDKPRGWNYAPPAKEVGEGGRVQEYCGLRNLGCICYMNSMMQQFFMIPALRYNLLCVADGKGEEMVEYRGKQVDDNMFHQMQRLFAHLEVSERSEYNPFGFCFAFKELDGGPTNVGEQKDAQEFLNLLFDRLETALKPTTRKYLLQGIFGGKQCSQMVCTECGKVKNRHEDFLNLSLNIKDIKSVYESLQKQIEGEIISDYQCDGCNRKVDLSKRTLIAETPNVLIVHLQRICFNYETFETDKVNTLCKFPTLLDLKPYSYFEVMGREDRLKDQQESEALGGEGEEKKRKEEEEAMTEEELAKKREQEEETREPVREDCFEYKLVGVNVHSGTANMGHYWSYINTNRGKDEGEVGSGSEPHQWIRTDLDPWMEFNDSRVSHFDFKDLEKQTFGNEAGTGFMGDSYGTSGYMLFYERRKKKALKIIVEESKVEQERENGSEVIYDEQQKEHYKMVNYREATKGEKANPIYQKVFEDNHAVSFEKDIYSAEFFDFVLRVMRGVAEQKDASKAKELGLEIGKRVGFDILARCYENSGLTPLSAVMIEILRSSDQACTAFMKALLADNDAEPVMEILFDCADKPARRDLIRIIRYLLCRMKEIEKDAVLANEYEEVKVIVGLRLGQDVPEVRHEVRHVPKSQALKFLHLLQANMGVRAAKAWKQIETYLELLWSFGVQSAADVADEIDQAAKSAHTPKQKWSRDSIGYQLGMTEYFRNDFVTTLGDFVLQDSSPLYKGSQNDFRISMGSYYAQPDFEKAYLLITLIMSDQAMQAKFPLSEDALKITQSKHILAAILKLQDASGQGFETSSPDLVSEMLNLMCVNNYSNTKKMAKAYVRELLNKSDVDDIQKGFKSVRSFLLIKDNLKQARFEWIFGVPQLIAKRSHQRKTTEIGLSCIEYLTQEAHLWKSGIVKGMGDALLTDMFKAMKTRVEFTIYALLELLELCVADPDICEYIYKQPPPTYQYARYSDWFERFATQQRDYFVAHSKRYVTYVDLQKKQNIAILTQILSLLPTFKEKCAGLEAAWKEQRAKASQEGNTDFEGYGSVSMAGTNPEVLDHYPPQYIIGQPLSSNMEEPVLVEESDYVTVRMYKVEVEYMYGNPTGLYNLSLPEKKVRNHLDFKAPELNYAQWKKRQMAGEPALEEASVKPGKSTKQKSDDPAEDADQDEWNDDERGAEAGAEADQEDDFEDEFKGLDVRQWHDHSLVTELYRIDVQNNTRDQIKVEIGVEPANDAADDGSAPDTNCHLPLTSFMTQVYSSGLSTKPVTAIITKIDPSKPLGQLKLTVGSKRIRSAYTGSGGDVGRAASYVPSSMGGQGGQQDPTYTSAYRNVVNSIQSSNNTGGRSVGFFVSQGNVGGDGGQLEVVGTSGGRRNGILNMINENGQQDQYLDDENVPLDDDPGVLLGDDGEAGFASDQNNFDLDIDSDLA